MLAFLVGVAGSLATMFLFWMAFHGPNQYIEDLKSEADDVSRPKDEARLKYVLSLAARLRRRIGRLYLMWALASILFCYVVFIRLQSRESVAASLFVDLIQLMVACDSATSNKCKAFKIIRVLKDFGVLKSIHLGYEIQRKGGHEEFLGKEEAAAWTVVVTTPIVI
ncbi:hypothetical protein B0T11DRAFT_298882 [Plectosphaerella cucumerina]|uniref:Uncharacterized protein n=1 Tax=Plectosphaerella cucumerina TaxID=40658 RepID=A0A8K0TFN3_9PEZI|nr:hypothetical protein B0T11DRAFT_298882 [Plectosphaerella cucumerina]